MRIALAQTHIVWEEKEKNIQKAEQLIREQASVGTEMVLFPEMSFTGFSMNTSLIKESGEETLKILHNIAKNNHISIGFGWVKAGEYRCQNIYTILNDKGDIISSYVKIHPFSFSGEDKYFEGGKFISLFHINDVRFTIFICYDLRFPELFRIVADQVHAVIVPANWPAKRSEHWKSLLRARAIENQVYIFAINCVGSIGGIYYSGDSCVINPNGEVIETIAGREGMVVNEFEDDVDLYRVGFPVLKDIIDTSILELKKERIK